MSEPQRIQQDFSRAAKQYRQFAQVQQQVAQTLIGMLPALRTHAQLLDIGCGSGTLGAFLCHPAQDFFQLDIAPAMCTQASSYGHTVTADMHQIPYEAHTFDGVLSSMALQWAEQPQQVVQEIHRVLKPGGMLALAMPVIGTLHELSESLRHALPTSGKRMLSFMNDSTYRQLLASHFNFTRCETIPIVQNFSTVYAVMDSIRKVGAMNKQASRATSITRTELQTLEQYYAEHFSVPEGGVKASWNIMYVVGRKR